MRTQIIHSFLLIGQSNMAGRGDIHDVEPIQNSHLHVLRNGRWQRLYVPVNPDRPFSGVNLAESFADAYQKDHDIEVGLIPCADGGTQLAQWKKGSLLFDHAVMQTRLAERTSTLAGILWHQGESDCEPELCKDYAHRLDIFVEDLRAALQMEHVPFLAGALGDYLAEHENYRNYYQEITRQTEHVMQKKTLCGFVSAKGLTGKPDHLHFTSVALREFGLRYYQVFQTLEDKNKVFVEKPCEDDALRTELDAL